MTDFPDRLDMADLIRLAGDGMSWEDTMRYIDETLAEGERSDRSSPDWLLPHTPSPRGGRPRRRRAQYDDLPPLPADFHVPDSPEGQPDRSPGWLHRQFVGPHRDVWGIPEHELDDRWNGVYDALGFDDKTREQWEAGRHTDDPSDKWDGGLEGMGGLKDWMTRAPMSKEEYARHREDSRNRAKGIADGLWNAMYPPEEEEGRKAIQNTETINKLMDNGWQPEHIKYDEDDQPYAHYQHPSGWNVTDHGGMYKEIGHAATPGEAHDVINVSHNIDGQDYHEPFGPADAHAFIEDQLHGDPEETGGTLHYLMQNHPAIRRYKPRQATRLAMDEGTYAAGDDSDFQQFVQRHTPPPHPTAPNDDPESPYYRYRDYAGLPTKGWGTFPGTVIRDMADYRMPDDGLPTRVRMNSRQATKDGKCTCWEGYERVPGTEPCASGSCRRKRGKTAALDWLPSGGGPSDDGGEEAHTETGHLIQTHYAYPPGRRWTRDSKPIGWSYSIWSYEPDPGDGHGPGYECVSEDDNRTFPTHDGAKAAAEEHYYRLNHSEGAAPESRIDYEKLINPRDDLDGEDFGHIFGRRLDMADLVRLAGDGMSYEDTMRHIDKVLAEGEGHDLHDYPGADYFPPEHSGYYDHSDILDHCRACGGDGLDAGGGQCEGCAGTGENQGDPYGNCDGCGQEFGVEDLDGEPDAGLYCPDCARNHRTALADPALAPQMPAAGGYLPAHRVGLDWRDNTIPGTVIGLDGDQLSIRWDDGQYTSENPTEVHLL